LATVDVFNIIFRGKNEHDDLVFLLACWIQHCISAMYLNIKII